MNLETVFEFIKEKRGYDIPIMYKLLNGLPLTDDELEVEDALDLYDTPIESLPDNLDVSFYVMLTKSKIKKLPNNLTVGWYLDIEDTMISEIPENLFVGGDFILINTPLAEKYDSDEIYELVIKKGGKIYGEIYLSSE